MFEHRDPLRSLGQNLLQTVAELPRHLDRQYLMSFLALRMLRGDVAQLPRASVRRLIILNQVCWMGLSELVAKCAHQSDSALIANDCRGSILVGRAGFAAVIASLFTISC